MLRDAGPAAIVAALVSSAGAHHLLWAISGQDADVDDYARFPASGFG